MAMVFGDGYFASREGRCPGDSHDRPCVGRRLRVPDRAPARNPRTSAQLWTPIGYHLSLLGASPEPVPPPNRGTPS